MDELQDAIQDAQYIGIVTNTDRAPTGTFYIPTQSEVDSYVLKQEQLLGANWFGVEAILENSLGFYFLRKFCEANTLGDVLLDFLIEITKYRSIHDSDRRFIKATKMWEKFCTSCSETDSFGKSGEMECTPISLALGKSDGGSSHTKSISKAHEISIGKKKLQSSVTSCNSETENKEFQRMRKSVGAVKNLRSASHTPNGIVFWKKLSSAIAKASVRDNLYNNEVSLPVNHLKDVCSNFEIFQRIKKNLFMQEPATEEIMTSNLDAKSVTLNHRSSSSAPIALSAIVPVSSGRGASKQIMPVNFNHCESEKDLQRLSDQDNCSLMESLGALGAMAIVSQDTQTLKHCSIFLYDELEACALMCLEAHYIPKFKKSNYYKRLLSFMYLQTRSVSDSDFTVLRALGRGGFGMVNGCIRKASSSVYAVKVMSKRLIKKKHAEKLCLAERKILASISSPFVVGLKYSYQTTDDLYLVLDLHTGGDLAFHLNRCRFTESQVRFWGAQVLLGLEHLHSKNIAYRDLKPENILLDDVGNCSISDLGLAIEVTPTLSGRCGTRGYWAPEMLLRDEKGERMVYNQVVDWWSFGCLLYEMLYGKCPFRTSLAKALHEDKQQAYDRATLELTPQYDPKYFSREAKELIEKLLVRDPLLRLGAKGAEEVKQMNFFRGIDWLKMNKMQISPPFKPDNSINAASQADIGSFDISTTKGVKLTSQDQVHYEHWDYVCKDTFQREVIEYVEWELRHGNAIVVPKHKNCCTIT